MDTPARLAHPMTRKRVVIIGGGFGGMTAARCLRDVDVILIDRTNHHVFQPLLYQVATASLSPVDIAWPLRTVFRSQPNVRIVMDEVLSIDRTTHVVRLRHSTPITFDTLIVTPGSRHTYFGHNEWESFAPGLKTLGDAVELRKRILLAFEEAERQRADTGTQSRLSFVIVGGGPTGVELAGLLLDVGRKTIGPDYPHLRVEDLSITLVEAGSRILSELDPKLSTKTLAALHRMGVTVKLNTPVTAVRAGGVMLGDEWIASTNVLWAAGTKASPLLRTLGVDQDHCGRIKVQPDLTIPQDPWIFVIGDAAHCLDHNGTPLPGIAPVAISEGRYVATLINEDLRPAHRLPFTYQGCGRMVTIGWAQAAAQLGPFHTSGRIAWSLWYVAHIFFLIGIRQPVRVICKWVWNYLTCKRGARLLCEQPAIRQKRSSNNRVGKMTNDDHKSLRRAA
ncbi:NAD(P)/FAD-dependent oxidoreductase [Nitrospira sp. BLG_1]|uniref:NAD(P)/FAD-dependent oxidoreductase n=1 Tax=Nitrospira sp. BLG_1 TaxID=3395883 RepID=UPI0039BD37BB